MKTFDCCIGVGVFKELLYKFIHSLRTAMYVEVRKSAVHFICSTYS